MSFSHFNPPPNAPYGNSESVSLKTCVNEKRSTSSYPHKIYHTIVSEDVIIDYSKNSFNFIRFDTSSGDITATFTNGMGVGSSFIIQITGPSSVTIRILLNYDSGLPVYKTSSELTGDTTKLIVVGTEHITSLSLSNSL